MIRNLIFDLGNVLLNWNPEKYLDQAGYTEDEKSHILENIFRGKEWRLLDNGDISIGQAIDLISGRSSMKKAEIRAVFDLRLKILHPIKSNTEMLPALKKMGYKLYFLSNFPEDIFEDIENGYEFFRNFDGGLISARARSCKPDKKIYELLLERFSLKPEECLFADDSIINVKGAEAVGMHGIHIADPADLQGHIVNITGALVN